jgi:hypothetical protein
MPQITAVLMMMRVTSLVRLWMAFLATTNQEILFIWDLPAQQPAWRQFLRRLLSQILSVWLPQQGASVSDATLMPNNFGVLTNSAMGSAPLASTNAATVNVNVSGTSRFPLMTSAP